MKVFKYLNLIIYFSFNLSCNDKINNDHEVSAYDYYNNFEGHKVSHLKTVYKKLKESGCQAFVFLAGDSSLDNKHWLFNKSKTDFENNLLSGAAINGYKKALKPPRMIKDINYWLNYYLVTKYNKQKSLTSSA